MGSYLRKSITWMFYLIIISLFIIDISIKYHDESIIISIIILLLYLVLSVINSIYYINKAQQKTRDYLLTNSLIDKKNVKRYYNNNEETSLKKLGLNCFESVLFTKTIVSKMFIFELIKIIIIVNICLFSLIKYSNANILFVILVSIFLYQQCLNFIRFCYFNFKLRKIYDKFNNIFYNKQDNDKILNKMFVDVTMEYECLKSYCKVTTSNRIFNSINVPLSKEWLDKVKEIERLK